MKIELRRIEPLRAANISAIIYGSIMAVIVVLLIPVFLLVFTLGAGFDSQAPFSMFFVIGLLFMYPVIGAVMGWITGLVGSACYNLIVRWTGGLLFEADTVQSPS